MIICFLADAGSANLQSWVEHFATQLGHETHIISLHNLESSVKGAQIHPAYDIDQRSKPLYLRTIPRIRKIIRSIKPDVLIGYRLTSYGFLAACTGFRPLVLAADGGDVQVQARESLMKRALVKYALRRADLVHAWSENIRDSLWDLGISEDRIFVMPRGIEIDWFKPSSELPRNEHRVITTRSLTDYCRIEIILKAIAKIKREVPDIEYLVVGDGPQRNALKSLADDLGLSQNVRFLGMRNRGEIAAMLGESGFYCSMLETDGLSASLHEAMAAGAFPVVTDIPANRIWVENGKNGFLVKANCVGELSDCILRAIRDTDLRESARQMNQNIVEKRANIRRNMRAFEKRYMELLNRRTSRTAN